MIERIYIHNYRCFENFPLVLKEHSSGLVIGQNGAGKSTLLHAMSLFQKICRGTMRIRDLIEKDDFTRQRTEIPMRFEINVRLEGELYNYSLALELPPNFREARVAEEHLQVNGDTIYSREKGNVTMQSEGAHFVVDWHTVGLTVIGDPPGSLYIGKLKDFFSSMVLLRPEPAHMKGFSEQEDSALQLSANNFASWFTAHIGQYPSSYSTMVSYLQEMMPALHQLENAPHGDQKQLFVHFQQDGQSFSLPFGRLSDGEKCFFLSALLLAVSDKSTAPLFCMWDEPDNHLSPAEIGHFTTALKKSIGKKGQLLVTSHHPETFRRFTKEQVFVLYRSSHLEPPRVRRLDEIQETFSNVEAAFVRGDLFA